jgi:HPt (histidine-containing phosphotransfer) domain-containing protein
MDTVARASIRKLEPAKVSRVVFDRSHLTQYTTESSALEREIIGLFTAQLPGILDQLLNGNSGADWRIATHTLKGSALAIGACKIGDLARELEPANGPGKGEERKKLLSELVQAIDEFDAMARQLYP